MNVLFDHQIFSTSQIHGGIARYYSELFEYLPDYGVRTELALLFSNNYYLKKIKGAHHWPLLPWFDLRMRNQFILKTNRSISEKRLKAGSFDIFHPTYYHPYFLEEGILKSKPFVLTVHDMTHERFMPDDPSIKEKRLLISRADRIIAISENTKQDILHFVESIDPDKIRVIYHGNNIDYQLTGEKSIHATMPKKDYILYVGARSGYKNFKRFVTSFSLLARKYTDINLICTGNAFNDSEKEYLHELGIMDKVSATFASDKEMAYLYKQALFFVYPSLYEGFGLPILEAFSLGCPVVISRASCFPEIAGDAASYFDPYDIDSIYASMEELLINTEARTALVAKGYKQMTLFSWEKTAAQTADLYKSI